ncbi:hypothetical protein [Pontibacter mangrovi]|nr:hypothetical protein [Pontibacter mangrovi]
MKRIAAVSSVLLLGASVSVFINKYLSPGKIEIDLSEEEYYLYL